MSAERELSAGRFLWQMARETSPWSLLLSVMLAVVVVALLFDRPGILHEAASALQFPAWIIGQSLFTAAVAPRRRQRPAGILNLTAASPSVTPALEPPESWTIAQPFVAGLSAAAIGSAIGLSLLFWLSQDPRQPDDDLVVPIVTVIVTPVLLIAGLATLARSTRKIFVWSQDVASAAAVAQADADAARIAALQAQMHPHFLFNALNTVASLVRRDAARAQHTIRNLTGMLRHTLERSSTPLTTLEDELQFVRDYLDIERERFGSRLQVTYDVAPDTSAVLVPTMSLQPLVENAIKHAIATHLEGGHVRVGVEISADRTSVRLSVEDDGPGIAPGSTDGTGLANLRARLQSLYGTAATLVTETLPAGARVSLTLPHHARPDR